MNRGVQSTFSGAHMSEDSTFFSVFPISRQTHGIHCGSTSGALGTYSYLADTDALMPPGHDRRILSKMMSGVESENQWYRPAVTRT
jgi:hypothetical protein